MHAGFQSSVPGLHFVGAAAAKSFGPLLYLVHQPNSPPKSSVSTSSTMVWMPKSSMATDNYGVGALVIGGEHPGLGIARSLGRRGIPVVVIDDALSISSFSRYVNRFVRVGDLRNEENAVRAVMSVGRELDLRNWVLFPTRDETVAAFSRHRDELAGFFRVTTPGWETVQWAWNKRMTYSWPPGSVFRALRRLHPKARMN